MEDYLMITILEVICHPQSIGFITFVLALLKQDLLIVVCKKW